MPVQVKLSDALTTASAAGLQAALDAGLGLAALNLATAFVEGAGRHLSASENPTARSIGTLVGFLGPRLRAYRNAQAQEAAKLLGERLQATEAKAGPPPVEDDEGLDEPEPVKPTRGWVPDPEAGADDF